MSATSRPPARSTLPAFAEPVSGPSYGRGYRVAATIALFAALAAAAGLIEGMLAAGASAEGWALLGGGAFVLIAHYVLLLRARTSIDAEGLRMTGLLDKKVAWTELMTAHARGWDGSRLIVTTTGGRFRQFFGGTPQLRAAFAAIAAAYRQG